MGCAGSKAKTEGAPPTKPSHLKQEENSFVRRAEGNRSTWSVPGESHTNQTKKGRQRSSSVDLSAVAGTGTLIDAAADDFPASNRTQTGARRPRAMSLSLATTDGAHRVHGWVVAKEAQSGARAAGRIAVRAEGNIELRTQLARSAHKNETFTPEEATFVLETITNHFLFRNMTREQQTRLLGHFQRTKIPSKDVLLRQGDEGARDFYIVAAGCLQVTVQKTADTEPVTVADLSRSACLGEMALLYACKRTATITALVDSEVRARRAPRPRPAPRVALSRASFCSRRGGAFFCGRCSRCRARRTS